MLGGTERPCSECGGKGVVVVKVDPGKADANGPRNETRTCPMCKGKRTTSGIVTK